MHASVLTLRPSEAMRCSIFPLLIMCLGCLLLKGKRISLFSWTEKKTGKLGLLGSAVVGVNVERTKPVVLWFQPCGFFCILSPEMQLG